MNQVSEFQMKRAVNIIWNCAGNYGFTPDFKAYDKNGQADIYWNCIIGALRRHYDYPQIEALFLAFQQYEDSDVYEGLLWLGLENCVYQQELAERPVLEKLRRDYASAFVAEYSHIGMDDYKLYDCMALAHYMRVLGQEPKMSRYDMKLLDELEFGPEMSTEQIVQKAKELFFRWFQIRTEERKKEKRPPLLSFNRKKKDAAKQRYRKFGIGFADHPANIYLSLIHI